MKRVCENLALSKGFPASSRSTMAILYSEFSQHDFMMQLNRLSAVGAGGLDGFEEQLLKSSGVKLFSMHVEACGAG